MFASSTLSAQQWAAYDSEGFIDLGRVISAEDVTKLRQRADDLSLGIVENPQIEMQLDTGGAYEALAGVVPQFDQKTLLYRKIQGLQHDALFGSILRRPLWRSIAGKVYGPHASVSLFRAMIMNKPANQGTILPWHQDGGEVWAVDRDPLVTVWIALDSATVANGCVEVIPGSHRLGLLSAYGSTLDDLDVQQHCPSERVQQLEVEEGHAILMHNWLIHRSGVNRTGSPRRAFTFCMMDGRTTSTLTGDHYPMLFGAPPAVEPYVHQLRIDLAALREQRADAERYALSLRAANSVLEESIATATTYARSLEGELARRPPA